MICYNFGERTISAPTLESPSTAKARHLHLNLLKLDLDFVHLIATMTKKKRKSTHDEEVLYQKRQKQDASGNDLNPDVDTYSAAKVEPRYNLTYGQRGAIPGLDSMSENGYSDEETHDALAYLRTVR